MGDRSFWEGIQEGKHNFPFSLGKAGPYMLFGVVVGSVLYLLSVWLTSLVPPPATGAYGSWMKFLAVVCEHLSMGFFVSTIAVLFYEWGSHERQTLELAARLNENLTATKASALQRGLQQMLATTAKDMIVTINKLTSDQEAFIRSIAELEKPEHWAGQAYIEFLAEIARWAAENATRLRDFSNSLISEDHNEPVYVLRIPHADVLTDKLLCSQMRCLGAAGTERNDRYITFSNPATWTALHDFRNAGSSALSRGVKVQRIFIMDRTQYSPQDANYLQEQYSDAEESRRQSGADAKRGLYEVQFVEWSDIGRHYPVKNPAPHYGVFIRGNTGVEFRVNNPPNLIDFTLIASGLNSSAVTEFDDVWKFLKTNRPPTPERFVDVVLRRELANAGEYNVVTKVSRFDSATQRALKKAIEAAKERVRIRHLIVTDCGKAEVLDVVEWFRNATREFAPDRYKMRLCPAEIEQSIEGEWVIPHSLIVPRDAHANGMLGRRVFNESFSPDASDFILDLSHSVYMGYFEQVWNYQELSLNLDEWERTSANPDYSRETRE